MEHLAVRDPDIGTRLDSNSVKSSDGQVLIPMAERAEVRSESSSKQQGAIVIEAPPYESQLEFLNRYCSWMIEDYSDEGSKWYIRILQKFLVTPFTNFTFTSIDYQLYLDLIFHRGMTARLGHYMCMPMVCFFFFASTAQWSLCPDDSCYAPGSNNSLDVTTARPWVTVALIFYVLAFLWYVFWGIFCGHYALCFMVIPLCGLYVAATFWMITYGEQDFYKRKWYSPTTTEITNPWMWMWIISFVQSCSHYAEPDLPPRVSGDAHWMSIKTRRNEAEKNPWEFSKFAALLTFQLVAGAIDEWLASFRLLPLFWLKLYFEAKKTYFFQEPYWDLIQAVADVAIASGQPGIDSIGFTLEVPEEDRDFVFAVQSFKLAIDAYNESLENVSCCKNRELKRAIFMSQIVAQLFTGNPDDDGKKAKNYFYGDRLPGVINHERVTINLVEKKSKVI